MEALSVGDQAALAGRLVLAMVLGGLLGWERQLRRHPAGLRTHVLVALGAAAFTLAGTYGVLGQGTNRDPGRVAAQVVTGIGFLGAGTIWRSRGDGKAGAVRGLTTAASIWTAAAVGMLAGYGLYVLAPACAGLAVTVLWLLRGLDAAPRVLSDVVARRWPGRSRGGSGRRTHSLPPDPGGGHPEAATVLVSGGPRHTRRRLRRPRPVDQEAT